MLLAERNMLKILLSVILCLVEISSIVSGESNEVSFVISIEYLNLSLDTTSVGIT